MSRPVFFFAPFLLVLCPLVLCGCQQMAWKAGASADDFKRDEQICREQGRDDSDVAQCLRDKGWSLASFSTPADGGEVIPAPEEANAATAPDNPSPLTESVSPQPAPSSQAGNKADPVAIKNEKSAAPINPLQRQSVQTWWKAGAHAADFQIDAERCLTQLGEQHTPDYAKRLYTRGMVSCLREHGWYAGSGPVYTPLR